MEVSRNGSDLSFPQTPRVVACGYKQVHIAKTDHSFPAWLVAIPVWSETSSSSSTCLCYYWRSKRDFMLLSRTVAKILQTCPCHCSTQSKLRVFSKAAFGKLSDCAPWMRPWSARQTDNGASALHRIMGVQQNSHHASMKKPLLQMDQFLQAIHTHCCDPVNKDEFDSETIHQLQKSWREFSRPEDSPEVGLAQVESPTTQATFSSTGLPTPQSLGQYFCTPENANKLVGVLLDKLNQQLPVSKTMSEGSVVDERHLVILEPSCGHGQVVWTLMEHPSFDNLLQQYQTVTIMAIDLDPRAIEVCQKKVASDKSLQNKIAGPQQSVHFHCHDFLTTKREAYCQHVWANSNCRLVVAAVGGPPYGSKPEERALPIQFVRHCVEEWKSTVIAFLVPKRFPQSLARDDGDNISSSDKDDCMVAYTSQCLELEDSTFYFHGTKAVTQPSRLQCWYQNDDLGMI